MHKRKRTTDGLCHRSHTALGAIGAAQAADEARTKGGLCQTSHTALSASGAAQVADEAQTLQRGRYDEKPRVVRPIVFLLSTNQHEDSVERLATVNLTTIWKSWGNLQSLGGGRDFPFDYEGKNKDSG